MIEKVLAGLNAAGFELDAEELADTLWLAAYDIFPARKPNAPEFLEAPVMPPAVPLPDNGAGDQPPQLPPGAPANLPKTEEPVQHKVQPEEPGTEGEDGDATLHAPTAQLTADTVSAKALPLRTPAALGLPGALELARALRPLRRRVPAKMATVLDEDETVRKIVEQDLWIPAMRPAPARWLELAVLVDTSPSMLVWQATLRELRLLFERLGAFRDVRMWTIDTADPQRVVLHTRDSPAARDAKELRDSDGRRAILVVSDCIAPAWDRALPPVLNECARHQPVAILQLFPERLWRQTALATTHRVQLSAAAPGVANARLRATFPSGPPGWEKPTAAPIPVMTTEPAALRAWARLVAHGGDSTVPAVVFEPGEETVNSVAIPSAALSPAQRIAAFQSNASATAFKLACILAAAPLQLPVMRLVQQALLPHSRQVHLAEVFVGGLLERVTPADEVRDPDLIEFAFHRGVDDLLLGANRAWEMMAVLEAVSHHVKERFGRTLDFQALIQDPGLVGDLPVVAGARPFATVAAKVLARFGGKYAQVAEKLRGVAKKKQREKRRPTPEHESLREVRVNKRPFENKRILWVDDHPERNGAGHARLEDEGAHLVHARSTEEGITKLGRLSFDAIITDLARAEGAFEGFELLKYVRAHFSGLAVAIYTSTRGTIHEREGLSGGALILTDDFSEIQEALAKHFLPNEEPPENAQEPTPILNPTTMTPVSKKTCFVIGPMGEGQIQRLKWLAEEVIGPILGDVYSVFTPDVSEIGNIMHHVIRSCDRADLVVADTTGNNPNVLYEMAILDAMGRACIPVKFRIDEKEAEPMPFDRAQYRYFELEQETSAAREKLKAVIEHVQAQRDRGELFSNPITNFFQTPLNSLASARGLARGYFRNFVTPCLRGEVIEGPDFALHKSEFQVQTLLPIRLAQATRSAVDKAVKQGQIKNIVIKAAGRMIAAYVWTEHRDDKNDPIVVDIPTALPALFDNVYARLGSGITKDPNSPDYRFLERDEIGQFIRYLEIFANEGATSDDSGLVGKNYRVIKVADSFEPNLLD